jgi:hypothetical protein
MSASEIKPPAGVKWELRTAAASRPAGLGLPLAPRNLRYFLPAGTSVVGDDKNARRYASHHPPTVPRRPHHCAYGWLNRVLLTMFPAHQAQHERRPVETAEGGCHE